MVISGGCELWKWEGVEKDEGSGRGVIGSAGMNGRKLTNENGRRSKRK
jgi:hypothetical protein